MRWSSSFLPRAVARSLLDHLTGTGEVVIELEQLGVELDGCRGEWGGRGVQISTLPAISAWPGVARDRRLIAGRYSRTSHDTEYIAAATTIP